MGKHASKSMWICKATWLSSIVVVPKKNEKIRIYIDYWKLNAITFVDAFPLPFTDNVLDAIAGHETCSFLDGFNGNACYSLAYQYCSMGLIIAPLTTFGTSLKRGHMLAYKLG